MISLKYNYTILIHQFYKDSVFSFKKYSRLFNSTANKNINRIYVNTLIFISSVLIKLPYIFSSYNINKNIETE